MIFEACNRLFAIVAQPISLLFSRFGVLVCAGRGVAQLGRAHGSGP